MLLPLFFRFVQRKEKHENALNRRIILRISQSAKKCLVKQKRDREGMKNHENKNKNRDEAEEHQIEIDLLRVIVRHLSNYCIRI